MAVSSSQITTLVLAIVSASLGIAPFFYGKDWILIIVTLIGIALCLVLYYRGHHSTETFRELAIRTCAIAVACILLTRLFFGIGLYLPPTRDNLHEARYWLGWLLLMIPFFVSIVALAIVVRGHGPVHNTRFPASVGTVFSWTCVVVSLIVQLSQWRF